jgi:hypothetical protein
VPSSANKVKKGYPTLATPTNMDKICHPTLAAPTKRLK